MKPMDIRSIIALLATLWMGLLPSFSQEECGTRFSTRAEQDAYESRHAEFLVEYASGRSILTDYRYIPIYFHIVRQSNGSGGIPINTAIAAMERSNTAFAGTQIRFFLCGYQYINESAYYEFNSSSEGALVNPNRVMDVANVFVVNSIDQGAKCGYAYYPNGAQNTNNHILMAIACMDGPEDNTLEHELGHFFDLPHTHGNADTTTELVDGSNCTTDGDRFCDTPADPNLSGVVSTSCVYTGTATDANGQVYVPNTALIMSYSHKPCRTAFSAQQIAKMNFTVSPSGDISRRTLNCTNCTNVNSYFEPFCIAYTCALGDYYRRNVIVSTVDITEALSVDQPNLGFIATELIVLLPGFRFDANSPLLDVFHAEIDPCTP
jgi:Pregnancy-associated plasma protein-A